MLCSKCKQDKDISSFWKKTNSSTGYNAWCKQCCRESNRISGKTNKDIINGIIRESIKVENKILINDNKKICSSCKNIFEISNHTDSRCSDCNSIKNKLYRENNLDKEKYRQAIWREKNRESINQKRRERYKAERLVNE